MESAQWVDVARQGGTSRGTSLASMIAVGGVCGLAWAAGLRGFMAEIAGSASDVEWVGTFGVDPAAGRPYRRTARLGATPPHDGRPPRLAMAPLLFASVLFSGPGDIGAMLEDGVGGGAIAVPLFGMAAGYALSGRGPTWGRVVSGAIALAPIPIWVLVAPWVGGPGMAVTTPRGAWVALYYYSFLAVLGLGCSIPHRRLAGSSDDARSLVMTPEGAAPTDGSLRQQVN